MRFTGSSVCRRCGLSLPDDRFPKRPSGHRGFICDGCVPPIARRQLDRDLEADRISAAKLKASEVMAFKTKVCKVCKEEKPNLFTVFQKQVYLARGVYVTADVCKVCKGAAIAHGKLVARLGEESYINYKATGHVAETLMQRLDRERKEREERGES